METKVCKCCGRELPIEMFANTHFGASHTCNSCRTKHRLESRSKKNEVDELRRQVEEVRNQSLERFTPRELMQELARRGYKGELTFTRTETININAM